jgi:hypothetical protein
MECCFYTSNYLAFRCVPQKNLTPQNVLVLKTLVLGLVQTHKHFIQMHNNYTLLLDIYHVFCVLGGNKWLKYFCDIELSNIFPMRLNIILR